MNAADLLEMAAKQWKELRSRGEYRVRDAKKLLDYWKTLVRTYAPTTFDVVNRPDVWTAGAQQLWDQEYKRWLELVNTVERRLASPTDTFNYRKEFEAGIKRAAIGLDHIRAAYGKSVPEFAFDAPTPKSSDSVPQVPVLQPTLPPLPNPQQDDSEGGMGAIMLLAALWWLDNERD